MRKWTLSTCLIGILGLAVSCASMDPLYWMTGSTVLIDSFTYTDSSRSEKIDYDLMIMQAETPGETFPLILALHASGSKASSITELLEEQAKEHRFMILAPFQDRIFENKPFDLEMLYALTDRVKATYPVDADRIYVIGISSGSFILRWMMMRKPKYFQKVVLISTETYEDWTKGVDFTDFPPMLFVHGEQDPVFDIEKIRIRVNQVQEQGGRAELLADEEMAHSFSEEWPKQIFEWIMRE